MSRPGQQRRFFNGAAVAVSGNYVNFFALDRPSPGMIYCLSWRGVSLTLEKALLYNTYVDKRGESGKQLTWRRCR